MNARRWLGCHPVILSHAERMQRAGLTPDTICEGVEAALTQYLPNDAERGEVIRILRRMLKHEATETIESGGIGDAGHFIPSNK